MSEHHVVPRSLPGDAEHNNPGPATRTVPSADGSATDRCADAQRPEDLSRNPGKLGTGTTSTHLSVRRSPDARGSISTSTRKVRMLAGKIAPWLEPISETVAGGVNENWRCQVSGVRCQVETAAIRATVGNVCPDPDT